MKFLGKHFPAPAFLRMSAAGLDISDHYIKYVELVHTHHGAGVLRFGKKEVKEGVIVGGVIKDPAQVVHIIKEIEKEIRTKFIRIALPEEHVYSFHLEIPRVPEDEIASAIEFQLEEHIPLSKADLVFDYDLITQGRHMFYIQVHAVARKIIESYEELFKECGLKPIFFELESQSIVRALELPSDMQNFVVVEIGKARSNVSIVHNKKVLATVTTNTSGDKITQALLGSAGGSFSDAEQKKLQLDLMKESDSSPVKQELSNLSKEIEKYFLYWKSTTPELLVVRKENPEIPEKKEEKASKEETAKDSSQEENKNETVPEKENTDRVDQTQTKDVEVQETSSDNKKQGEQNLADDTATPEEVDDIMEHIFVCGGGSNMTGLAEFMSKELKTSVEKATVWNAPKLGPNYKIPEDQAPGYSVALGLALVDYRHD